jgi:hypothetical protein
MRMVPRLTDLALPLLLKCGLNEAWSKRESAQMPTPSCSPPTALLKTSRNTYQAHMLRCSVINSLTTGSP